MTVKILLNDNCHTIYREYFIFREKLKHYNIKFHENSTMSYTAKRYLIFLPEENTIDFNATVITPNVALLVNKINYLFSKFIYFLLVFYLTLFLVIKLSLMRPVVAQRHEV